MSRFDDFFRLYSGDIQVHERARGYDRSGVRLLPRTTDVNAFLASCGIKGRRR